MRGLSLNIVGILLIVISGVGFFLVSTTEVTNLIGYVVSNNGGEEISGTEGIKAINIRGIKTENDKLNIVYIFDSSEFAGNSTYVEAWIEDQSGFEVGRIRDTFSIGTDDLISRSLIFDLPENEFGTYDIYLLHPSEPENYVKRSVVAGKPATTGKAVFEIVDGKGFPYAIFLLIMLVGVYFIFRSHRKAVQKMQDKGRILNTANLDSEQDAVKEAKIGKP